MARRFTTLLLGSISLAACIAPAWADQPIEEVVVTATKRSEEVKNIPMSITVLGQDELDRLNARSFEDIAAQVPGLNINESNPTHPVLEIRGINAGGDGATVGTYIDEAPYNSSNSLANGADTSPNIDTYDMRNVEVLRGPQGTLYGATAIGGVFRYVTNAPSTAGFDDSFELGGFEMGRGGVGGSVRGMINVPLTDDLAIRIVGFYERTPGYIDNVASNDKNVNDLLSEGGRASILYQPTSKITVRVSAIEQQLDADGEDSQDMNYVGTNLVPFFGSYKEARFSSEPTGIRYFLYNGTINWDLDFATLTSATSYSMLHDYVVTDASGVYGADVQGFLHVGKFTQELRLASDSGQSPLDWLVGFYYSNELSYLHQDIVTYYHGPQIFPGAFVQLDSDFNETAGFANATYHVTDQLELGVGGRYAHNGQAADEFGLASALGASSADVFTWSADARYHVDQQTTLYARAASGYQPGGPNDLPPGAHPGVPTSFAADTLNDYEVGAKSDLMDGKLSFDADVYYINWNKIQLLTDVGGFNVNNNGGTARSEGAEAEVTWIPVDRLTLNANVAYTDAELTQNTDPLFVGGNKGDPLPWTPKWAGTLNGDYTFLPVGDYTPYIGGTWHYVGSRSSDFVPEADQVVYNVPNRNQYNFASYNTLDLRAGVNWDKWSIEIYGKNLTGAKGITDFGPVGTTAAAIASTGAPAPTVALIQPRIVGIVFRGHF